MSGDQPNGALGEVVEQALAFDGAVALDVVADADEGLVVGLDARPCRRLICTSPSGSRALVMAAGLPDAQELLGQGRLRPHGRLGVAVEDLLGDIREMLSCKASSTSGRGLSTAVVWPRKRNEPCAQLPA